MLSFFGFPLTGGSNFFGGGVVIDTTLWFLGYFGSTSGQLIVANALFETFRTAAWLESDILDVSTVVQNFDYAGTLNPSATVDNFGFLTDGDSINLRGDLGLSFRVYGAENGTEISLFNAGLGRGYLPAPKLCAAR